MNGGHGCLQSKNPVSMPDSRRGSSWLGTHKMKHLPISSISSSIVTSLLLLSPCIQPPHLRPYPSSPSSWWPSAALTRFARSAPAPGWWCWPLWSRRCQPSPWSTSVPWGDSHSWGAGGTLEKVVRGVRVGRSEHLKQARRTRVGFSSVLRILLCSYFRAVLSSGKFWKDAARCHGNSSWPQLSRTLQGSGQESPLEFPPTLPGTSSCLPCSPKPHTHPLDFLGKTPAHLAQHSHLVSQVSSDLRPGPPAPGNSAQVLACSQPLPLCH